VEVPVTVTVTAMAELATGDGGVATGDTVVITSVITDALDDASEATAGTVRTRETAQRVGRGYLQGWRFTNVAVPAGAVIVSAKLELYGTSYTSEDIVVRYLGEASADAAPFAATARNLTSRVMTDEEVVDTPAPWVKSGYNAVPDLAAIVQEIVEVPGWQQGSALALFAVDDGSDAVRMVATAETTPVGTRGARLTITYRMP
jgi:hypothetical protein